MTFVDAIKSCYQKYATLSGRANRSEFWYFNLLFYAPLLILYLGFEYGPLSDDFYLTATGIFVLANFLPILAVSVRRLHDVNMSGWWLLIRIVPLLGDLYLLIKFCTKGDGGQNRFGDSTETRTVDQKDDLTEQYIHRGLVPTCLTCTSGQYKGYKFPLTGEMIIGTDPARCSIVIDVKKHPGIESVHCEFLVKNSVCVIRNTSFSSPIAIIKPDEATGWEEVFINPKDDGVLGYRHRIELDDGRLSFNVLWE